MPNRKKSKGRGGGGRGRGQNGQEQLPRPGRSEAGAAKPPEEKESLNDEEPEEARCCVAEATSEPDQPIPSAEEKLAFERSRASARKPIEEEKPQEKPSEQLEPEKPGPSHLRKGKTKGGKGKRQPVAHALGESPTTSPPANKGKLVYKDPIRELTCQHA